MGLTEQQQADAEAWERAERAARAYLTVEAIAKGRPDVGNIPALRQFLLGEHDSAARYAAHALGRLGPKAHEATEDLVAAATLPWKFGCPQRFPDAMESLLRIAPDHPRLTDICREALSCHNYGIQKAAVVSLWRIGSPEAVNILRIVDAYRDTSIQGKLWDRLMAKVLQGPPLDVRKGAA